VLSKTVPSGGTIAYTYDALNRAATKTPAGEVAGKISYGYDLTGPMLTATDASSANAYKFACDTAGRQISRTDQNNLNWGRGYDAAGNLLSQVYPNGYRVSYQHGALDRVTEIDFQWDTTKPIAKYQWDALSRRILLRG
jgi:YD repeat-containing protein